MSKRRILRFAALCAAFALVGTAGGIASASAPEKKAKPKLILEDDFVDDSNGWGGFTPDDNYSVIVADGQLVLRNEINQHPPSSFADSLLPLNDSLGSQRVEVDASLDEGGVIAGATCLFNADLEAPDYSEYTFGVWPDTGIGRIWKRDPNGEQARLFITKKPVLEPGTTQFRIGGDCIQRADGSVKLILRVNGKAVLSGVDTEDPITRAGLPAVTIFGMAEDSFPVQVSYDNFKAFELR